MKTPIYMDHHATTPVDPAVLAEMMPCFEEAFGNAASRNHSFGWAAEELVEKARERIARLIHCSPKEIVFTSGATESDNLAIRGVAEAYRSDGNHVVTLVTEHPAVLDTARSLEKVGLEVTYLPVDPTGRVELARLGKAITDKTILITIMAANNEIGTIQPIAEIGKLAHERGVIFHTDAAQAAGKIPLDCQAMEIDLMSLSAHKMYGPKGVGALYVRRRGPRVRLSPLIHGGGHERGFRSGTLNVPAIVGFGKACEIALEGMETESKRIRSLRDRLHQGITSRLADVTLNGQPTEGLAGNLNLSFAYVEGESLLMGMRDVAVSSGSACTSATLEPSHVLLALGIGDDLAHASIRFGLGRFTTEEEVDYVIERVVKEVNRLREMSPLYGESKRHPRGATPRR
ncbi:MAG: IscS subfamily cysteine desulfurase [Planctomycetota bacterium]|nr:IscS subfamily cysteine desulfurase [Planctomycetota bacterium]